MSDLAYLVIREGAKWTDVFRLVPGQTVTIGRAPTNQVVVKDERCSRNHAELFVSEGQWIIRDLDSRNGTVVQDQLVKGDCPLKAGDLVRIGRSQLIFVNDLSEAFSETSSATRRSVAGPYMPAPASRETSSDLGGDSDILGAYEPTTITHRRGQTRFLTPADQDEGTISRAGRAAAYLCRLAFELAKVPTAQQMAELALAGVFDSTQADTGAVLLLPPEVKGAVDAASLEVVASRTTTDQRYHQVSTFLARTVLREQEAVLARNVMGDSVLGSRDSKGEILATSVICAPVRHGQSVLGVIHLYSTNPERALDPEDLEFTLAVADTLAVAVTNLNRREELAQNLLLIRNENVELRERLGVQSEIIGRSAQLRQVTEEIARAAASKATVLIRGESGVGKELVARAVHFSSSRSKKAFVCLNCAALSEDLLASELFGHEKGAFTGATDRKIGKFEAADGGTLMLDEIGEMSPNIQAKFLRVLEGHPFERVGGSKPVKVDVRVIAATNRDLEKDAGEGRFRRDLFFRLRVLEILVPALRKRPDDIPVLANYFLEKFRTETGRKIRGYTPRAMEQLIAYRWPGNVRELRNVVERAVVLCTGQYIDQGDLLLSNLATAGDTMQPTPVDQGFRVCSLADMERNHIDATLRHTGWNKSRTAGILGIERSTLDRKIRRYRLTENGA